MMFSHFLFYYVYFYIIIIIIINVIILKFKFEQINIMEIMQHLDTNWKQLH